MWFIGVEVEQETSAPRPKKNSWIRPWVGNCEQSKNAFYKYHLEVKEKVMCSLIIFSWSEIKLSDRMELYQLDAHSLLVLVYFISHF